jgi:hypothetical protein
MSTLSTVTLWYRKDEDGVYQFNHLENDFDGTRKGPTPKVPEHEKLWRKGKWGMASAVMTKRSGQPDLISHPGAIVPV